MSDQLPDGPRQRILKNKPKDSKWRQQTLPAYRPLLTARCMSPIILIQGLIYATIGVLVLLFDDAKEVVVDYTCCEPNSLDPKIGCNSSAIPFQSFTCKLEIRLNEDFLGDVKFQYGLDHFFQNNRLYIKSRNDVQLTGELNAIADCDKYATSNESGVEVPIAPCGLVANSMFNDSFRLFYHNPTVVNSDKPDFVEVPFSPENVIWSVEREKKYKNPSYDKSKNETLCDAFKGTAKPLDWQKPICELGNDADGYGFENVDFIAWMKPAALPKFRKNYRTLKPIGIFGNGLLKGNYTLHVQYNYPILQVSGNRGKKSFVIARDGILGGKNQFLPITFIAFGSFCVVVAILFLLMQFKQRVKHYD